MLHTLIAMRDAPLTVTVKSGQHEGTTILVLTGPLTLQNSFDFQNELARHKPAVLIIDLTESPYMDSAGLGLADALLRISREEWAQNAAGGSECAHPRAAGADAGGFDPEELCDGYRS